MKSAELRLAKQRAAAFALGRLSVEFHFYLAQSLALSILPRASHLHPLEQVHFDRARDILSRIVNECGVLSPNIKLDDYLSFARSQLERFVNDTPQYRKSIYDNVHTQLTKGVGFPMPWLEETADLPLSQVMLHGVGTNLRWSLVNEWLIHDIICRSDMFLFDRIWSFLHDKPTTPPAIPSEETDDYEGDFNILQRAFAVGYWLDQCTHPIHAVCFMNLMDHPQFIDVSKSVTIKSNTPDGNPKTMKAHSFDNGGPMIFRCLSAGDLRPQSATAKSVRVLARRYFFSTSITEMLQSLYSVFLDTSSDNFIEGDIFTEYNSDPPHKFKGCQSSMYSEISDRDQLNALATGLGEDIHTLLLHPGGLANEDRDRWMYQLHNDGKKPKEIAYLLNKLHTEWDPIHSEPGVLKAIDTYVVRRRLEKRLSGLGRPPIKKMD